MIPPGCSFPSRGRHRKVMNWMGRTIFGSMNGKALDVPGTRLRRPRNNASPSQEQGIDDQEQRPPSLRPCSVTDIAPPT
jgi:hypothetical protein